MSIVKYNVKSLLSLSFKQTIKKIKYKNIEKCVSDVEFSYLWITYILSTNDKGEQVVNVERLMQFLQSTQDAKRALFLLFKYQQVYFESTSAKYLDQKLLNLMYTHPSEFSQVDTLMYVVCLLCINVHSTCLPEDFYIMLCMDSNFKCRKCSDQAIVPNTMINNYYKMNCCGDYKIDYYDHDHLDELYRYVFDITHYCVKCFTPLYCIVDAYDFYDANHTELYETLCCCE